MNYRLMELVDIFEQYIEPEYRNWFSSHYGEDILMPDAPDSAKAAWAEYSQILIDADNRGID